MWFDLFVTATLLAVGCILFGQFEAPLPKARRLGKLVITLTLVGVLAYLIEHWSLVVIAAFLAFSIIYHYQWCRRYGINPITAEPWDAYLRALRQKYGDAVRERHT